jgi:hypothetical protein
MDIGPAPLLAVVVGLFHASLFALLTGSNRARLALVLAAAILGAFAGQAMGSRLYDPLRIGDFGLVWASGFAWLGILVVSLVAILGPAGGRSARR